MRVATLCRVHVSFHLQKNTASGLFPATFRSRISQTAIFRGSDQTISMVGTPRTLVAQTFASNALDRSTTSRRNDDFLQKVLPEALYLLVSGREVLVDRSDERVVLWWHTAAQLQDLGLALADDRFVVQPVGSNGSQPAGQGGAEVHPSLLGQDDQMRWKFVLDAPPELAKQIHAKLSEQGMNIQDLRSLMAELGTEDVALAGQALALSQWHAGHAFCGLCGAPTHPIEAGAKRACDRESRHRVYPRTDPVAIMLVESLDGSRALLGRSKRMRPGMLTCLSGFIEQGETIEEAVAREVSEEAGASVGAVTIIGSQPWPIGRGGSCELMIGCMAKATSDALNVDFDEMEDVRWVTREQAARAVLASQERKNPYPSDVDKAEDEFWIPPPYAIAHHLIKEWVARSAPWFPSADASRL